MLSIESPRSAITSITFSGGMPSVSITFSRSSTRLSFTGFRIFTCSFTSCIMSLSFETTNTGCPAFAAFVASVPITSSASKPCASRIGIRNASSARRTYGNCCARSGGIASRLALYPPVSTVSNFCVSALNFFTVIPRARSSRNTGPDTSNTAAKYSGSKSLRSLLTMLMNT